MLTTSQEARASGRKGFPPGPGKPRALQTLLWFRRPCALLDEAAARFGTPFTLRMLGRPPQVVFSDPEHVREIFTGSLSTGAASPGFRVHAGPGSILSLDGKEHRRHRRVFNPFFRTDRMPGLAEQTWERTLEEVRGWPTGPAFRLLESLHALTLDLVLETIFGRHDPALLDRLRGVLGVMAREVSSIGIVVPFLRRDLGTMNRWGRFLRAREKFDAIVYAELDRAREESSGRTDLLAHLVAPREGGGGLSNQEIRDEIVTFLAVGHATTTAALTWTFQSILADPEIHARVIAEARNGAGSHGPQEPGYLDAVVKESLRLNPPVLMILRNLGEDTTVCGLDLPAGTLVRPSPYLTHRDARVFPEPERFRPERFLEGRQPTLYEHYPFGGGRRTCIGADYSFAHMRVILAAVFSQVDLALAAPPTRATGRLSLLVVPAHGTPVRVIR